MTIYHYTTIETLELILKNKNIRFNRLDQVDDPDEYIHGSGPKDTKLGQYTFVSCWTKQMKENADLWKRYTDNRGVRIGLPEELFETYQYGDGFKSFFKKPMDFGYDYMATPFNNPAKLYDVVYLDEQEAKIKGLLIPVGGSGALIETEQIGIYKKTEWNIQEESRFKINVCPFDPSRLRPDFSGFVEAITDTLSLVRDKKIEESKALEFFISKVINKGILNNFLCDMASQIGPSIGNQYELKEKSIYLPLKDGVLDNIEVMMGPQTTKKDIDRVEELLKGIPNHKIVFSQL